MRESGRISHPWKEGSSLTVTGTVYRSETKEDSQSIYLKNISIDSNSVTSDPVISAGKTTRIKAELNKVTELQIGNQIQVTGVCQYFSRAENDGGFDAEQYYASKNIVMLLKKANVERQKKSVDWLGESCRILKEKAGAVLRKSLSSEEAGVMESLLLGEKSGLDGEIRELYQKNGIIHVLAISGVKTLKLDIPLVPETRINWAFVPLHIAIIYILKLCLDEEIIPRCRFPCSRGYFTKCINWQKKQ